MQPETRYMLLRASEEAQRAINSEQPEAATVHQALSIRYSAKAVTLILAEDDEWPVWAGAPRQSEPGANS